MTAYLIFIAMLAAVVVAAFLVVRSRKEPGGRSGVHPERGGRGAPLGEGPSAERPRDVERLRRQDAELPDVESRPARPGGGGGRKGGSGRRGG